MIQQNQIQKDTSYMMQDLFSLAHEKTEAGRQRLYRHVWDLFENRSGSLSERERALMLDILKALSLEIERSVRTALAEKLAENDNAPRELVMLLAHDESEVAFPILMKSNVLRDKDLIEIIVHRAQEHQLAIAMREHLSGEVCQAIVDTGNVTVITRLIDNPGAELTEAIFEHLVEQSQRIDAYQRPLLCRKDLPCEMAKRMYAWVGAALREHILENFEIDRDDLDDALSETMTDMFGNVECNEDCASEKLVRKLERKGGLTPKFLLETLRQGEIHLFEHAFSRLSGLRMVLTRRILYEPGGEGLGIACRIMGLDYQAFARIVELTRKARPEANEKHPVNYQELRSYYENIDLEEAKRIHRKWLRNQTYLSAIKQMGLES